MNDLPEYLNHDKIIAILAKKHGLNKKKVAKTIRRLFVSNGGMMAFFSEMKVLHIKGIGTFRLTKKGSILKSREKAMNSLMNIDRISSWQKAINMAGKKRIKNVIVDSE